MDLSEPFCVLLFCVINASTLWFLITIPCNCCQQAVDTAMEAAAVATPWAKVGAGMGMCQYACLCANACSFVNTGMICTSSDALSADTNSGHIIFQSVLLLGTMRYGQHEWVDNLDAKEHQAAAAAVMRQQMWPASL
jgi:hypothetical protein